MNEIQVLPNILCKFENPCSNSKQWSAPFAVLNSTCKLKLIHLNGSDGEKLQLFLRRITSRHTMPDVTLNVISYVVASRYFMEARTTIQYSLSNEWCIWSSNKSAIKDKLETLSQLTFSCLIHMPIGKHVRNTKHGQNNETSWYCPEHSPCTVRILQDFASMYNNEFLSDVTLICGGKKIHAHQGILAPRSKEFKRIFQNERKGSLERPRTVNIQDMDPRVLELVIRYIYGEKLPNLPLADICKVSFAAKKFDVESLKIKCMAMVENVNLVTHQAETVVKEQKSCDDVKDNVSSYFADIGAVLCSEEWENLKEKYPKLVQEAFELFVKESP